jgi:hypothetical protein
MLQYGWNNDGNQRSRSPFANGREKIVPLVAAGLLSAGGGLLRGLGSFLGGKSKAKQMDKYNREQEAKTLAYRTREGAKRAGSYLMGQSVAKAYGLGDAGGGAEVQGPMGTVTPTPYVAPPVDHPSAGAAIFDTAGGMAQAAGAGMSENLTYEDFMKYIEEKLGGVKKLPASTHSSNPDDYPAAR